MTDAADGGIARSPRRRARSASYRVRSIKVGQILQQPWCSPFTLIVDHTRARERRRQQQRSTCSTGWRRRCGAATAAAGRHLQFSGIVVRRCGRADGAGGVACAGGRLRFSGKRCSRIRGDDGAPAAGESGELPGHRSRSAKFCNNMGRAWPRSLRAFAQNDQQKTTTVYFNLALRARARGERRQQQRRTRRLPVNRLLLKLCLQRVCSQKGVYAPAIGLCKDPTMTQSKKPSNADF